MNPLLRISVAVAVLFPCLGRAQVADVRDNDSALAFDLDGFDVDDGAAFESEVISQKLPATAGESQISSEQIARRMPTCTDEALTLASGITVVQHGAEGKGHQLFLRGFDAAHGSDVEVTLDGVSLNEPSNIHGSGYLDLYGIIPETIQKMTVHKGPFLPFQGNFATGGTVAFELGVPSEYAGGLLRSEVDIFGRTRAVALTTKDGDANRFIAVDGVFDPGFAPDRDGLRMSALAKYSIPVSTAIRFETLASGQLAAFSSPGTMALTDVDSGEKEFYDTYDTKGHGEMRRALVQSSLAGKRERTDWRLQLYGIRRSFQLDNNYTGHLLYPDEGDLRRQQHDALTIGSAVHLRHRVNVSRPFSVELGGGWRSDQISQAEQQITEAGRTWQTNLSATATLHHLYAFTGLAWSPFSWMTLQPSVRVDGALYDVRDVLDEQQGDQTFLNLSPRITTSFPVTDSLQLFAALGKGFRLPEARSVLNDRGTEDVNLSRYSGGTADVSSGYAGEAGVQIQPNDALKLKATGYLTVMQKEMVFDHVSGTNLEKNRTRRAGSEVEIGFKPVDWFSMTADAAVVWARFVESGNKVPGVPEFLMNVRTHVGKPRGAHGGLDMRIVGTRPLPHGASVNGYLWGIIRGGWRFERFDVTAVAENIFFQKIMAGAYHFSSQFDGPSSSLPKIHYAAARPFSVRLAVTIFL